MNLSVATERLTDGRWKATLVELPQIFYAGKTEEEVLERMDRLLHALRSPHIEIDRINPDGDVVLTLRRPEELEEDDAPPARRAGGYSLCEAATVFSMN